jgi:hypothetical protein
MTLLGDRCWYLPHWLSRLPGRTSAEPGPTRSTPAALAATPDRGENWAIRGAVAAGRGIALVGLTRTGLSRPAAKDSDRASGHGSAS